jgi:hypothetical protein
MFAPSSSDSKWKLLKTIGTDGVITTQRVSGNNDRITRTRNSIDNTVSTVTHTELYEIGNGENSACARWMRSICDIKLIKDLMRVWCRNEPFPGKCVADQMTYLLCVFAFGDIDMRVRTSVGVSMFKSCPRILDLIFGQYEDEDRYKYMSDASVRTVSDRKYRGIHPAMEKYNIPYEYMTDRCAKCIYAVIKRPHAFGETKLNMATSDHEKLYFKWNDVLDAHSSSFRCSIIHWYLCTSIFTSSVSSSGLYDVIETVCSAMQQVEHYMYIYERQNNMRVHAEVKAYIREFNDKSKNYKNRGRVYCAARLSLSDCYLDKISNLYFDRSIDEVLDMFTLISEDSSENHRGDEHFHEAEAVDDDE